MNERDRQTVMVVEDDHDTRVSLRYLLEEEGYIVLTATDGHSALELLESRAVKPCLILLDLMLPVMDGWHFATHLRERPALSDIPIVIMSAFREPPPPEGIVGFLHKPINAESLLKLVENYC
jgi:CheY-like chemotaxis protein